MSAYIRIPFASSGDKAAIPNTVQPDGSISAPDGYGVDYQLDPSTPPGLNVARDTFNQLMYETQLAIQKQQQFGFPEFITTGDNGGTPFPYAKNATVRAADGNNYYSLIDVNTDTPPSSNWGLVLYTQPVAPGTMELWAFQTIKSGYVWLNGATIGDGSSGATGRANADTATIFTMLWTDWSNAVLPIQDSSGAASTRGISAAADFAAHKRLPTPDYRGRGFFGLDNMGGASAAGRVTVGESGIAGTTLGSNGGAQSVALTGNQNGNHTHTGTTDSAGLHNHTITDPGHVHSLPNLLFNGAPPINNASPGPGVPLGSVNSSNSATTGISLANAGAHSHTFTTDSSGLGSTHQNMPPAMIGGGYIMKL